MSKPRNVRAWVGAAIVCALCWPTVSVGVMTRYVYWTGESALVSSSGTTAATKTCYNETGGPILCYPSFASTGTHYAFFQGFIPADISTAAMTMTCNVIAAPATADDLTGTIKFTALVYAIPSGEPYNVVGNSGAVAIDTTINSTYAYDITRSTNNSAASIMQGSTGFACPADTTCVGAPGGVRIGRLADDVGDSVETSGIVTRAVCSYPAV